MARHQLHRFGAFVGNRHGIDEEPLSCGRAGTGQERIPTARARARRASSLPRRTCEHHERSSSAAASPDAGSGRFVQPLRAPSARPERARIDASICAGSRSRIRGLPAIRRCRCCPAPASRRVKRKASERRERTHASRLRAPRYGVQGGAGIQGPRAPAAGAGLLRPREGGSV